MSDVRVICTACEQLRFRQLMDPDGVCLVCRLEEDQARARAGWPLEPVDDEPRAA